MKHNYTCGTGQAGVALVVALLFLLIVTILSVTAARNSSFSLQMSSNMQDANSSFQAAEAGAYAALALASLDPNGPGGEAFNVNVNPEDDPLAGLSPSPLANLDDPNSVDTFITFNTCAICPTAVVTSLNQQDTPDVMGQNTEFKCEYYRVDSEHSVPSRARTRVALGVVYPKQTCP
tara:strand:- start:4096 stop:4626 length:531 start_codon:yes stop_codon:yes gene_type:complete